MNRPLRNGLAAGAAGATALNAVTYLDMALRGRAASNAPEQTVDAVVDALGGRIPGSGDVLTNRRTALGALTGIGAGVGVGVVAALARAAGLRLPAPIGGTLTGAAAMAATDVPMAALGVSDPRSWSASAWVSDAVPHLAYGLTTHAVLVAQERRASSKPGPHPVKQARASTTLVLRSAALGVATGARSSLGLAGYALSTPTASGRRATGRAGTTFAALMLGGELVGDKLPQIPDRLDPPALLLRLGFGAGGAAALARRQGARAVLPALAGAAGAAVGAWGGHAWRAWAADRLPDWGSALIEDGVALSLAAAASLPHRNADGATS